MRNVKSDVLAKAAFVNALESRGFNAKAVSTPADIKAVKEGQDW